MAKLPVPFRLDPEKLGRVDAYAKARGRSRQTVLEQAVDNFLEDAEGGVPDLPEESAKAERAPGRQESPMFFYADSLRERQARLNAAKYGRKA